MFPRGPPIRAAKAGLERTSCKLLRLWNASLTAEASLPCVLVSIPLHSIPLRLVDASEMMTRYTHTPFREQRKQRKVDISAGLSPVERIVGAVESTNLCILGQLGCRMQDGLLAACQSWYHQRGQASLMVGHSTPIRSSSWRLDPG